MSSAPAGRPVERKEVDRVTIRFAGDSGDGMQLVGTQFTNASAVLGNDVSTLPDYPAEIRAPQGSLPGVSAFQLSFASEDIFTPGDQPDVLVAMNPAALKVNLPDLPHGATIIVNDDEFNATNLRKAGYDKNPLDDDGLSGYRVHRVPITSANARALADSGLTANEIDRCKNFFALGLMFWLYDRPLEATLRTIEEKFEGKPQVREANKTTLKAGHAFAETAEMFPASFRVPPARLEPGMYRNITGNAATALGFVAASQLCGRPLFYGSYPITPASEILQDLARYKNFGVRTFQAEDEIAGIGTAIGAAYGGALGLTGTSGPGLALKGEAIGLAVMTELPLVIVNVQRAGPSTGLPTKTEQSDLLQAMFGRNGESPVAVVAPCSPGDCFHMAIEAARIAIRHMTPVIYLSDGYLGNGSEPWRIPDLESLPRFPVEFPTDPATFKPYARDEKTLARPWGIPGTPGLEHRLGGLEKANVTGMVCYDAANHDLMVKLRAEKVARIAADIPEQPVFGPSEGDVLVISWGGTYGAVRTAVQSAQRDGFRVAHAHVRYIHPMPANLGEVVKRYRRVLVPELNLGQLLFLLRARYLVDAIGLNKVAGQPFRSLEVYEKIAELCRPNN
ncbi:MAG: 2-oxoacid:acceptor oxidoreductase subunit alpha [Deltaproteobacteria bacterium]|nr:2-oxoacid:acceptor oxidoreductase subunit alpha [Deltaproteobacteria bacterium]